MINIRKTLQSDLESLKKVIESTQLFPPDMLEDMTRDFFSYSNPNDVWLTILENDMIAGVCYCAPEKLTNETFNLYLIAIHRDFQNRGLGKKLLKFLENTLKENKARILIIETSSLKEFESTRKFYSSLGYKYEAKIADFYDEGDDKIIFWKKLT